MEFPSNIENPYNKNNLTPNIEVKLSVTSFQKETIGKNKINPLCIFYPDFRTLIKSTRVENLYL